MFPWPIAKPAAVRLTGRERGNSKSGSRLVNPLISSKVERTKCQRSFFQSTKESLLASAEKKHTWYRRPFRAMFSIDLQDWGTLCLSLRPMPMRNEGANGRQWTLWCLRQVTFWRPHIPIVACKSAFCIIPRSRIVFFILSLNGISQDLCVSAHRKEDI